MKKPLKIAAWSGIIMFALVFISSIISIILRSGQVSEKVVNIVNLPFTLATLIAGILMLSGFIILGKRFKNTLLVVLSWISIAAAILMMLFVLFGGVTAITGMATTNLSSLEDFNGTNITFDGETILDAEGNEISQEALGEIMRAIFFILFIIYLIVVIPLTIFYILWGIALIRLDKKNVELAKATGVVNIVAGATMFIFVGMFVAIAATIMEIILLFKASKKFETSKRK